ncbi:MAG: hypothetical protein ACO3QC_12165 [Phycisphaerales bacterium]
MQSNVSASRPFVLPLALCAAALCAFGGCNAAKDALRADFTDYNTILQTSETRQMLLNLVRLHYRESPLFMQAGSLTASYENVVSTNASGSLEQGDSSYLRAGAGFTFSSKPTISYSPVEGKEYVQQFMAEITPDTFALLMHAGWPVRTLGELIIAEVRLPSGERLIGNAEAANYAQFVEFLGELQRAESANMLRFVKRADGGVDCETDTIRIGVERFRFRSLFSAMFLAARNIDTPEDRRNWTTPTAAIRLLDIRVSEKEPADALVAVEYSGSWYSIANDDIASKDMLALLLQLLRIKAGPSAPAPLVTIPAR